MIFGNFFKCQIIKNIKSKKFKISKKRRKAKLPLKISKIFKLQTFNLFSKQDEKSSI